MIYYLLNILNVAIHFTINNTATPSYANNSLTNSRTPHPIDPNILLSLSIALSSHFDIAIRTRLRVRGRVNHHRHRRHRTVRRSIGSAPIRRCKERGLSSRQTSDAVLSCRCSTYTG